MNEMRRVLDTAIGEPPPSRIDIDDLIRTQRKSTLVRRWGAAGAAMAAVVAISLVSGWLIPGAGPAPADRRPQAARAEPSYNQLVARRLGMVLRLSIENELPVTRFLPSVNGDPFRFRPLNGVGYLSDLHLRDSSGTALFVITVSPAGLASVPTACGGDVAADRWADHVTWCAARSGPNGERIVSVTSDNGGRDRDSRRVKRHQVYVSKPDGTVVDVWVRNWCDRGDGCQNSGSDVAPEPTRLEVPLSIDQMIGIALNPGLSLPGPASAGGNGPIRNEVVATRLERVVWEAVHRELPKARLERVPAMPEVFLVPSEPGKPWYRTDIEVAHRDGIGTVIAVVTTATVPTSCDDPNADQAALTPRRDWCQESTGPAGERIVLVSSSIGNIDRSWIHAVTVFVTKPDGTAVKMWGYGLAVVGRHQELRPSGIAPLLPETMVEVALDPGLTLRT